MRLNRASFHSSSKLTSAPIVPKVSSGIRIAFLWKPLAGPPAPAAISDVIPKATRSPLSPTAATHMLSAAASANDPQLSNSRVGLAGESFGLIDFKECSSGSVLAYANVTQRGRVNPTSLVSPLVMQPGVA